MLNNGKKYEILKHVSKWCKLGGEREVYRIRALRSFADVKAGDVGGWIEKEENLSHEGNCWVYDDSEVVNASICTSHVLGDAVVKGNSIVHGSYVLKNAVICDNSIIRNTVVTDNASVSHCFLDYEEYLPTDNSCHPQSYLGGNVACKDYDFGRFVCLYGNETVSGQYSRMTADPAVMQNLEMLKECNKFIYRFAETVMSWGILKKSPEGFRELPDNFDSVVPEKFYEALKDYASSEDSRLWNSFRQWPNHLGVQGQKVTWVDDCRLIYNYLPEVMLQWLYFENLPYGFADQKRAITSFEDFKDCLCVLLSRGTRPFVRTLGAYLANMDDVEFDFEEGRYNVIGRAGDYLKHNGVIDEDPYDYVKKKVYNNSGVKHITAF